MNADLHQQMRDLYRLSLELTRSSGVLMNKWPHHLPLTGQIGKRLREEPELAAQTVTMTLAELYHASMTDMAAHAEVLRQMEVLISILVKRDPRDSTLMHPLDAMLPLHAEVERYLQGGRLQ